jgi:methylated-DNA-[protein]-cysteine S-methyltransferase
MLLSMDELFTLFYPSPVGLIEIKGTGQAITSTSFVEDETPSSNSVPHVLLQCKQELDEYFTGKRKTFNVPLAPVGTEFQQQVWGELLKIDFGTTTSYMAIAKKMNNPGAVRAVGLANGKNPIGVIIPCHRVIGEDGSLTGYAGGLWRKRWLLDHEGNTSGNAPTIF